MTVKRALMTTTAAGFTSYLAAGVVYEFIQSLIFVLITLGVVFVGACGAMNTAFQAPVKRAIAQRAQEAERQLERARYAQMSHLTAADERYFAERHFFSVPKEVARIREGLPWDQVVRGDTSDARLPAMRNRKANEKIAERARAVFEGDNVPIGGLADQHVSETQQVYTGEVIRMSRPERAQQRYKPVESTRYPCSHNSEWIDIRLDGTSVCLKCRTRFK